MTDELRVAFSSLLPVSVEEVEVDDPNVLLVGQNWSVAILCPWRLTRGGALIASSEDRDAEASLRQLVGALVVDVGAQSSSGVSDDPLFVFQDGSLLEIFSDTGLDPWVVRLPVATFVGGFAPVTDQ